MASLFDQNFRYTDRARAIFKELQRNLHIGYGWKPRTEVRGGKLL
ncbi:hypothetical protein [Parathermosynechococcus lividus]|nr:hypothetical protein [Thermostichus lividus]